MMTKRVHELEAEGKIVLELPNRTRGTVASYAAVNLDEIVATEDGESVYVARDGYSHTRVLIRNKA